MIHVVDILTVNNHCLPIADTGDCTEGVTATVIGALDDPPVILTTTSINPDDSEPVNCADANSTTNTIIINSTLLMYGIHYKPLTGRVNNDSYCSICTTSCY